MILVAFAKAINEIILFLTAYDLLWIPSNVYENHCVPHFIEGSPGNYQQRMNNEVYKYVKE